MPALLPSQWSAQYGEPILMLLDLTSAAQLLIPRDPDRTWIAFWSTVNAVNIFPGDNVNMGTGGWRMDTSSVPLILGDEQFPGLAAMAFTVVAPIHPTNLSYLVQRMPASFLRRRQRPALTPLVARITRRR